MIKHDVPNYYSDENVLELQGLQGLQGLPGSTGLVGLPGAKGEKVSTRSSL